MMHYTDVCAIVVTYRYSYQELNELLTKLFLFNQQVIYLTEYCPFVCMSVRCSHDVCYTIQTYGIISYHTDNIRT